MLTDYILAALAVIYVVLLFAWSRKSLRLAKRNTTEIGTILANAKAAGFDFDPSSGRLVWSDNLKQLFRVGDTELEQGAAKWQESFHPNDLPSFQAALAEARQTGILDGEWRILPKGSGLVWLEIRAGLDRTTGRLVGLALDITARKQAEQARKLQDSITDAIMESIGDGFVVVDSAGLVSRLNPTAAAMLGLDQEAAKGQRWLDLVQMLDEKGNPVGPADRPLTKALGEKKKTSTNIENTFYLAHGPHKVPVALSTTPVVLDGLVIGAIELFRDISAEAEVDRAKNEFVSLASHQLKTPSTAVNWFSEMLLDGDAGKLTDQQREYLTEIYSNNQRMVELVNILLNISRLELGVFRGQPQDTDMVAVTKGEVAGLKLRITQRKLKVTATYPKQPLSVHADPELLKIVVNNLLTNAFKYTPEGKSVAVSLTQVKDQVEIKVADTGIGIPPEQQSKVFEKLYRADNAKVVDTTGTGLGLYMVKGLVEHMGGTIRFESTLGKGTTFFVDLPLAKAA